MRLLFTQLLPQLMQLLISIHYISILFKILQLSIIKLFFFGGISSLFVYPFDDYPVGFVEFLTYLSFVFQTYSLSKFLFNLFYLLQNLNQHTIYAYINNIFVLKFQPNQIPISFYGHILYLPILVIQHLHSLFRYNILQCSRF